MKPKLKEIREAYGLSTYEMAKCMAITQSAYMRMESGKTKTDLNRLEDFAKVVGMSLIDVITYPQKYVPESNVSPKEQPPEVTIQLKLSEEKRDAVLQTIFGKSGIELINI